MTDLNITVIGGGSTYTPELVEGFIVHRDKLPVKRLTLMDISAERLDIVGGLTKRMLEGTGIEVVLTQDREAWIKGADFVLTQFRVGGMAARANDEHIPMKYGVIGQETTGPGGFTKALRTVPQVLDIAHAMETHAPDAFLINFTNPSGLVTEAIVRHSKIRVMGLCNVPINMLHGIAEKLGVDPGRVTLDYVGLNHLSFARTVYLDGKDVTEQAMEARGDGFDESWLRAIKMVPNYYLRYFVHHNHAVEEVLRAEETRADYLMRVEADLLKMYRDPALRTKPALLMERGGARYSQAAVGLIYAIVNNLKEVHIVNVRNGQSLPDLPEDSVVEVPAVIDAHGAVPQSMGRMPPEIRGLIQAVKAYEELTIDAALTGDINMARLALMAHPLVPSWDVACALLDDLIAVNRQYLPQFAGGAAMIFLGVDGGGTKTHALALDELGNVIGTGTGGRSNYHSLGLDRAMGVVSDAARQALGDQQADMAVYCLAACDTREDEARLTDALTPLNLAVRSSIFNDAFAVLRAGASHPYGVSVICGTGFNACGIAPDGRRYSLHSLGALTGDWGGGYSLGEAACAAVFRADEGRSGPTILKDMVLKALAMPDLDALTQVIIKRDLPHPTVAALAPLVFEAAEEGDEAARAIIVRQADEIVVAALAILRRFEMTALDVDVVLGGGVMHGRGPLLVDTVSERIAEQCPLAHVKRLTLPPVVGATLLAFDALAVPVPPLDKLSVAALALA